MSTQPLVTVAIPARNESAYIERCLRAIVAQDYPHDRMEVLLVDGMSTDDTLDRARSVMAAPAWRDRFRIIENQAERTPHALNLAIGCARGDLFVRVDGHCEIAGDYVRRIVEVMQKTGADCVGGLCETVGETDVGRVIAVAQSSRFGVGNVAFRVGQERPGPADTVPFGAYPTTLLRELGGFDEELVTNQDDELNFRLIQRGGVVWLDPSIRSRYFSRGDLGRLWRQYFRYGESKVRVMQKRGGVAAVRHLVPGAMVTSVVSSLALALWTRRPRWGLCVLGPYAIGNAAISAATARRTSVRASVLAAAFAALHFGYGVGFLAGMWRWRRFFLRA